MRTYNLTTDRWQVEDEEIEVDVLRDEDGDRVPGEFGFALVSKEEAGAVVTDREHEICLLRRERRLLVDLDKARAETILGLLNGQVRQSNLDEIERLQKGVLALHLEARNGVLLPEGVPCGCLLCAPKRDLLKVDGQDGPMVPAGPRTVESGYGPDGPDAPPVEPCPVANGASTCPVCPPDNLCSLARAARGGLLHGSAPEKEN